MITKAQQKLLNEIHAKTAKMSRAELLEFYKVVQALRAKRRRAKANGGRA